MNKATTDKGRPIIIPQHLKGEFKALTGIPDYSWPAIFLAVSVVLSVIVFDVLALMGVIPLAISGLLVSCSYYWFFSVIHDGVHRSLCKNKKLNDFIGQLSMSVFAPFASISLFRWAHMEHHRFTNGDKDPDSYSHGVWWTLPFRWMTIDFYYAYRLLKSDSPQAVKTKKESLSYIVAGAIVIGAILISGYWLEYLTLWFLPSRLAFMGIAYSFFWLPHSHWPNSDVDVSQANNYTLATVVRLGKEWALNPLLQYQNYHLIHHLWPTTPFYNNQRVWLLLEDELRERDLAIADGLTVLPELVYAPVKEYRAAA